MGITITDEQIKVWREREKELESELVEVKRKLELVDLWSIEMAAANGAHQTQISAAKPGKREKGDTVIAILREKGRYMAPREVKELMQERKVPGKWGEGYMYVHQVLRREVKNGRIKRHPTENKYKVA